MKIHTIGIDLGKTKFHVVGLNERGEVVVRKQFSRAQLVHFTANRKVHLIGMEACYRFSQFTTWSRSFSFSAHTASSTSLSGIK